MSITFVARTMETRAPSIVLKTRKCLEARDMSLLAGGIVNVHNMRKGIFFGLDRTKEIKFGLDQTTGRAIAIQLVLVCRLVKFAEMHG